jgi:hypothetical protein
MSETWVPTTTTPGSRAAGMRQLSRLTAGLSIGAVAATGATAAVVGVDQLLSHGTNVLSLLLGDGDASGGAAAVVPIAPSTVQQAPAAQVAVPAAPSVATQQAVPAAPSVAPKQAAPAAPAGGSSGMVQIAPPTGTRAHATTGGS